MKHKIWCHPLTDTKESNNQSEEKEKGSDDKDGATGDGKETENKVYCLLDLSVRLFMFMFLTLTLMTKNVLVCLRRCSAVQCSSDFILPLSVRPSLLLWHERWTFTSVTYIVIITSIIVSHSVTHTTQSPLILMRSSLHIIQSVVISLSLPQDIFIIIHYNPL